MNKKEILEIKKQLKPEKSTFSKLCCCYVNHEKEKILETSVMLLALPEEEQFKYFDIFRRLLTGGLGKNMLNLEVRTDAEQEGGAQAFLMELLHSRLEDEALLGEFFDRVIANFTFSENYLILLAYGDYDVPGKGTDGKVLFDASELVYSPIMCAMCPVSLDKPALAYNPDSNELQARIRDWIVGKPVNGFLFPAFQDRQTDIHNLLFYAAKPEEIQPDLLSEVLGCLLPMTAGNQKDIFRELTEEALEQADFETAKAVQQNLNALVDAASENPEPLELTRQDVLRLLEDSGAPSESLDDVGESFDRLAGPQGALAASNISQPSRCTIETTGVKITADPEALDQFQTRVIDGRTCLVIPVENRIELNGILVNAALPVQKH